MCVCVCMCVCGGLYMLRVTGILWVNAHECLNTDSRASVFERV